jgi:hypothetical protein
MSLGERPSFNTFRVLRGPKNFEDYYQGISMRYPIVLSSRDDGRDPVAALAYSQLQAQWRAGTPNTALTANTTGIDPWLVAGEPAIVGSTVRLVLPAFSTGASGDPGSTRLIYQLTWRFRTSQSYREARRPFHAPRTYRGQNRTAEVRNVIIPFYETIAYPQAETTANTDYGININAYNESIVAPINGPNEVNLPVYPDINPAYYAAGAYGQGLSVANTATFTAPKFFTYETTACGDEFVLTVMPEWSGEIAPVYDFDSVTNAYFVSFLFGRSGYESGDPTTAPFPSSNPGLGAMYVTGVKLHGCAFRILRLGAYPACSS